MYVYHITISCQAFRIDVGDSLFARIGLLLFHGIVKTVRPARLDHLFGPDKTEFTIGNIAGNRASGGNNGISANSDRRN